MKGNVCIICVKYWKQRQYFKNWQLDTRCDLLGSFLSSCKPKKLRLNWKKLLLEIIQLLESLQWNTRLKQNCVVTEWLQAIDLLLIIYAIHGIGKYYLKRALLALSVSFKYKFLNQYEIILKLLFLMLIINFRNIVETISKIK